MWWEFQSTLRNALTDTHAQTKKAKRAADTEIYGAFVLRGLASIVTWSLYLFFFPRDFGGDGRADWREK